MVVVFEKIIFIQNSQNKLLKPSYNYDLREYEFIHRSFQTPEEENSRPTQPKNSQKRKYIKNHKPNKKNKNTN